MPFHVGLSNRIRRGTRPRGPGIGTFIFLLTLGCTVSAFARDYSVHGGLGVASASRYGMLFTLGGTADLGEIPLTVLKITGMGGLYYLNDSGTRSEIVSNQPARVSVASWWAAYQGVRFDLGALTSSTGLQTSQGLGLAVHESLPFEDVAGKDPHHRVGKTELSLQGMGYIRYDLNPGRPVGLFVEADIWISLLQPASAEAPPQMIMGMLGIRFPGL